MKMLIDKIKLKLLLEEKRDHKRLFHDIENLDEILHKFSIVAIKDTYQSFANRFLLYYDNAWKCWFFFSFHTEECQNEEHLVQRLSNSLKVNNNCIKLHYISDRLQPKYSERDHQNKVYQHSLYEGIVSQFPNNMKQTEFTIDGVQYKWFTISEMEADSNIMKKNEDVVSFVKEKIG